MIKFWFLLGFLGLIGCVVKEQKQDYPETIIKNNLITQYTEAKYLFYLMHANKYCIEESNEKNLSPSNIFLSYCPVLLNNVIITDSTLITSLSFKLDNNNTCVWASSNSDNKAINMVTQDLVLYIDDPLKIMVISGNIMFNLLLGLDSQNKIHYSNGHPITENIKSSIIHEREKYLFPFLLKNKHNLDMWFLTELKRRKVLP